MKSNEKKKIDQYVAKLPQWSKGIFVSLRTLIHQADKDIEEDWKWGQPAFSIKGNPVCFIWAFSKHVNFTFMQGALIKDTHKLFNYGEQNKKSRSIKFTDLSELREKEILEYIKLAVANEKDGKHVRISVAKNKTVVLPTWLKEILKEEGLLEKYKEQIYTYRKGYLQWIEEAKQEKTKQKRIRIILSELRNEKTYMGMKR